MVLSRQTEVAVAFLILLAEMVVVRRKPVAAAVVLGLEAFAVTRSLHVKVVAFCALPGSVERLG